MIKDKPCTCEAYRFPHRLDSGKCRALYNAEYESEQNKYERHVDDEIKSRKENSND